jgi:hypothetical protein
VRRLVWLDQGQVNVPEFAQGSSCGHCITKIWLPNGLGLLNRGLSRTLSIPALIIGIRVRLGFVVVL